MPHAATSPDIRPADADAPLSGSEGASCTNCGAALHGSWCSHCGERQPGAQDWSLAGLFHEAVHTFTSVDGTLWRTLHALVRHPGLLTAEYFAGRKSRYMRPMALFIALNVAFFVIQPHTGLFNWRYDTYTRIPAREARMEATRASLGLSRERFRERFDASLNAKKRSMLLVEIPLFALAVAAVHVRRRRPLAQHVVFSIHAYAFFALFLGVFLTGVFLALSGLAWLLGALAARPPAVARILDALGSEASVDLLLVSALGTWLALAVHRVYGGSRVSAAATAVVLLAILVAMISYQSPVLFELTLRTM